jgi:hypothetical protein
LLIAALIAPVPAIAGNCGVGVGAGVGNPHCSGGPRVPQTNQAGVQPVTGTQPPTQLGGVVPDHHNTVLAPAVVTGTVATVTGYGPVPQGTQQPAVTGTGPVPQQVTGTQPTITGYGPVPQGTQQPAVTGTGPVPRQVTGTQPTVTGYGPIRQGMQATITGYGSGSKPGPKLVVKPGLTVDRTLTRPIVVTGTQPTITGYGPVPQGTQQPAVTGTGPVPQQVTGAQPTMTGYGPVPQGTQQPAVTGTGPVPQTVTGTQPTITGYGPVPQGTQQPAVTGTGPVPQQVTGTQTTITGYGPVPQGTQQPAITATGPVPQQVAAATQTAPSATSAAAVPSSTHRNALLVHAPNTPQPVTSGAHPADGIYSFEFIEPGLQHRKVKVYRTRDAAEEVYKDTIPLDQGGFQLIIIGTRNPSYVH